MFPSKRLPSVIAVDPLVIELDGLHVEELTDGSPPHEPLSTIYGDLTERFESYAE